MRIDPVLAELRRDPAPQLRAQAALEQVRDCWRAQARTAAVLADLESYGAGAPLANCAALDRLVSDPVEARAFVGVLVGALAPVLGEHPLGHVPLRHQYARGLATLQLAQAGGAALSLVSYERGHEARAAAETVCFAGGERHELCLAGEADVRAFAILSESRDRAELACTMRHITPGETMRFSGPRRTRIVESPRGCMVLLRLSRPDPIPTPAREYRISDGALVHRASGDRSESRDEMAAAVLGAMQRVDAAPVLAELARSTAGEHLRWQALCQALTLDTAIGFAALAAVARDETDSLATPAGALRASLIERHPMLAGTGTPCPA